MLVSRHSSPSVLAGKLAPIEVECVAIAVTARVPERGDVPVLFEESQLPIVGNITPHQILALRAPGRSLRPFRPHVMPLDGGIEYTIFLKALVHRNDVRVGVAHRLVISPVALHLRQRRSGNECQKRSATQTVLFEINGTHRRDCIPFRCRIGSRISWGPSLAGKKGDVEILPSLLDEEMDDGASKVERDGHSGAISISLELWVRASSSLLAIKQRQRDWLVP